MKEPDDDRVELSLLKGAISRYLTEHPQAADTVEGVHQWWLSEYDIRASRDKVLLALEDLVREGIIEKSGLHDGTVIYGLMPRKH